MDEENRLQREESLAQEYYQERHRRRWHQIHFHIHPLVGALLTGTICIIVFCTWAVYAIFHHEDFINTSLSLVHDFTWWVRIVFVMFLIWGGIQLGGMFIEKVLYPLVETIRAGLETIGQLRRNSVLKAMQHYAVLDSKSGPTFHQVTQERYNYTYRGEIGGGTVDQAALPMPSPYALSQDQAIEQLHENQMEVCMGSSKTTMKPHVMPLLQGTHYRFIGGTGGGKTCLAGSMVDQVTKTNDQDHLRLALLDPENKVSKLFAGLPHIAELQVGRRRIECVATTPEEVVEHLQFLRTELHRRETLSEYDLQREPVLLMYVEEFLALRRQLDKRLVEQFLTNFSILASRARKYRMHLLACAQVDYASQSPGKLAELLREAQDQYNVNGAFAVRPRAAQAAGFMAFQLAKQVYEEKQPGQYLLEMKQYRDIMLAPHYDVTQLVLELDRRTRKLTDSVSPLSSFDVGTADVVAQVLHYRRDLHWNKQQTVEKVWNCTKGGGDAWKEGSDMYDRIIAQYMPAEAAEV